MFKTEHMGVSPSQANCHTSSYSCPKQSISEEKPEFGDNKTVVSQFGAADALQLSSEDVTKSSVTENLDLVFRDACKSGIIDKSSSPRRAEIAQKQLEFVSEVGVASVHKGPSNKKDSLGSGIVQNDAALSNITVNETLQPLPQDAAKGSSTNDLALTCEDARRTFQPEKSSPSQKPISEQTSEFPSDGACCEPSVLQGTPKEPISDSGRSGCRVKTTAKSRKKYMLRSLRRSDRVLRSRSQEKPKAPESGASQPDVSSNIEKTRKKKKKRRGGRIEADEYSKIRTHLRYLLNRIGYERSLITAYSAEGWKGLSLEKLKPEKELQRATSEIFRRKSKIRDLFQRIDSLCAEGRFPESLFDSDGQISSEDIFCAKCGSKDLTADNDIILCDGACDRGFHQFCLVPPLLKEDIPPDDEGWLCPGCDCKVDCVELLNESQGTNICISDSWEKVFPEVAAAGQNPDENLGLPADDSDDNDYDPNRPENDEKSQGDESSSDDSDDSDFTSDELEAPPGDEQHLGLSSEDSEDDDFNPDAPDLDDNVKEESSSSDFTSDSEDLAATLGDNKLSGEEEGHSSIGDEGDSIREESKHGRKKKQSLHSELLSIAELNSNQYESSPISRKRNVERLDYKKLYDETYGNVSSDSSDDEDFTDAVEPTKISIKTEAASAAANGHAPMTITGKSDLEETAYTPKRSHQRFNSGSTRTLPAKAHEGSSPSSSFRKKVRPSVYKRLGEAATQGLYRSFKENQYPDRAKKESLAKELGITFQQVTKWFENARWSFNHSTYTNASTIRSTLENNSPVPTTITKPLEPGPEGVSRAGTCNVTQTVESPKIDDALVEINIDNGRETVLGVQNSSAQKSKTPKSRKRKHNSDNQILDTESTKEELKTAPAILPEAEETRAGRRVTRSKSVA